MLKRVLVIVIAFSLCICLASCTTQTGSTDDNGGDVAHAQEALEVESIVELHEGIVWDVSTKDKVLLFSWDKGKEDPDPNDEMAAQRFLYKLNLNDNSVAEVNHLDKPEYRHESLGTFSPNGKYIAYMENVEESFSPFILENKDGAQNRALEYKDYMAFHPIAWSPNSKHLAIVYRGIQESVIVVYNTAGEIIDTISAGNTSNYLVKPSFCDNDKLAFVMEDKIIYKGIGQEDGEAVRIVDGSKFALSKDNNRLAYIQEKNDDGQGVVKVTTLNGDLGVDTTLAEVSVGLALKTRLAWSPDGKHLVYTNDNEMWVLDPESGDELLISNQEAVSEVFWVNDKEFVFTAMVMDEDKKEDITLSIQQVVLK